MGSLRDTLPARTPGAAQRGLLARLFDIQALRLTYEASRLVIDGDVPCYQMKKGAGAAVADLVDPVEVLNRLRVAPRGYRSDGDLERAARSLLRERHGLASASLEISVSEGILALRGRVPSTAVRSEVEAAIWTLRGVVDVVNQLRMKPDGTPSRSRSRDPVAAA